MSKGSSYDKLMIIFKLYGKHIYIYIYVALMAGFLPDIYLQTRFIFYSAMILIMSIASELITKYNGQLIAGMFRRRIARR